MIIQLYSKRTGKPSEYIKSITFCCTEMSASWERKEIILGQHCDHEDNMSRSARIDLNGSFIDYCPFCGKKIYIKVLPIGNQDPYDKVITGAIWITKWFGKTYREARPGIAPALDLLNEGLEELNDYLEEFEDERENDPSL